MVGNVPSQFTSAATKKRFSSSILKVGNECPDSANICETSCPKGWGCHTVKPRAGYTMLSLDSAP